MNKSLGTTVALGFAGMGAVVGTLIVIAWELTQRVDAAAVAVQTHARETRDVYAALALKAKDMRLHVVQVQQWLTDISATRAAPGFDDGFATACWWAMRRWVVAALRQMVAIVDRVASGDLSASVAMGRRDEIGQLGAAFNGMTESLRHSYAAVLINKTALDSAAVNVMMCDREYNITYANGSSSRVLHGMEGELRRVFPGFTARWSGPTSPSKS